MTCEDSATPKVTVCVVTYNQEKYIEQCLQSIVDQETDFDFEIIVSDDCSTDKTREIIQSFADKYSNVKPLLREKNIGALENFVDTHRRAAGEYICHMDGDDYWLPTKLQKQVDFLDDNSECNLVWTRSLFEKEGRQAQDLIDDHTFFQRRFYRGDIIRFIAIGTNSSHMYRGKYSLKELPTFGVVDYFKNVEVVGEGYASFVNDEPLIVYRIGVGISSNGTNIVKIMHSTMHYFYNKYPKQRKDLFSSSLLLSYSSIKRKRWTLFSNFILLSVKSFSLSAALEFLQSLKVYSKLRVPVVGSSNVLGESYEP